MLCPHKVHTKPTWISLRVPKTHHKGLLYLSNRIIFWHCEECFKAAFKLPWWEKTDMVTSLQVTGEMVSTDKMQKNKTVTTRPFCRLLCSLCSANHFLKEDKTHTCYYLLIGHTGSEWNVLNASHKYWEVFYFESYVYVRYAVLFWIT